MRGRPARRLVEIEELLPLGRETLHLAAADPHC